MRVWGEIPFFYSCRKRERLERRSRLTASAARSCGDVHLADIVVTRRPWLDMPVAGSMATRDALGSPLMRNSLRITCRFRVVLRGGVQGGADGQPL